MVANLLQGCERPLLLAIQSVHVDTTGNVNALGVLGNVLKGTLDTIEDAPHDTGAELDGQGLPSTQHGVSNTDTRRLLVHLGIKKQGNHDETWMVAVSPSRRMISPTS